MILDSETKRKLGEMGCPELASALESQEEALFITSSLEDRLKVAVDTAYSVFLDGKIKGLITRARLRYEQADIRTVDLDEARELDRIVLMQLATCAFVRTSTNVVIEGFTGSGKSYLVCALVKEACRHRLRGYYIRVPDLLTLWEEAKEKPQGLTKMLKKLANYDCLCLDEWLFDPPEVEFRSFLFELLERRYERGATVFCTQYKQSDWHQRLGGGVHADAIMDRIVHGAVFFNSGKVNMREKLGNQKADKSVV